MAVVTELAVRAAARVAAARAVVMAAEWMAALVVRAAEWKGPGSMWRRCRR
jgi:hypothetical protein